MVLIVPLENLNALAWVLFTASTLVTFGRFYIRWQKARRLYLDDIFNASALASLLVFMITYQIFFPPEYQAQLYALGLGGYLPSEEQLSYVNRLNAVNVIFFWVTIYFVKASFLSLYWTIFGVNKKFRIAWMVVAGYTVISFLVTFLAFFWGCGRPSQIDSLQACTSITQQLVVNISVLWCVLNVVGDFATMILPMWMIRDLRITTAQKLGLALISGLVIIDVVFDLLRTIYTIGSYAESFPNANAVWDLCEPSIAVMVCALPTYRSLLGRKKNPPSSPYEGLGQTRSTGKSDSQSASVPHEMDNMEGYSLHSTTSQSALGRREQSFA